MTRHPDVDRVLETWLAEGPSELPDRVIDSIVTQLDKTNQRRSFGLPGRIRMNRMILGVGSVAAALVLAAAGAGYLLGPSPGFGNPTTPTASPAHTTPPIQATRLPFSGPIEAGRYFVQSVGHSFSFTVPDGWQAHEGFAISPSDSLENAAHYGSLGIWGWVSNVYVDPCRWIGNDMDPPPGPTVADFAAALASQDGWSTSQPTAFSLSGYDGIRLQLTIPDDVDFGDCDQDEYRSWDGRWYRAPGQIDDVRLVDLDGARRLFLTTYFPETSPETMALLQQIVATLEIEAVPD